MLETKSLRDALTATCACAGSCGPMRCHAPATHVTFDRASGTGFNVCAYHAVTDEDEPDGIPDATRYRTARLPSGVRS